MSHPKNQHYVPQFILKNFCFDSEHLFCFDKKNEKSFSSNVRNVASENYFYDLENGVPEFSYEYDLGEVEKKASVGILKLIKERSIRNLSKNDYENISFYIATQLIRTKNNREKMWHINRETANILRKNGTEPNKIENFHEFESEQEVKEMSLYNLSIADALYPYLLNKKWILYSSNEYFIISDNPVTMQNTINKNEYRSTLGLASEGIEIYIPLSPSLTLCLLCMKTFEKIQQIYEIKRHELERKGLFDMRNFVISVRRKIPIECKKEIIENINSLQVIYAERFIFSKTQNFELAKDMISKNIKFKKGVRPEIQ